MYDDQTRKSRRLGAGLQGKYQLSAQTELFGEVAMEREYEDGSQDLTMALTSLPNNSFTLEGYRPESHLSRASLGVSQQLTPELALRGGYSLRHSDSDTQQGVSRPQPRLQELARVRPGAASAAGALRSPGTRGQLPRSITASRRAASACGSAAVWRPASGVGGVPLECAGF
jgi:hypothetical protein